MSGGGGIANGDVLRINNGRVDGNSAPGGVGDGILNHGSTATLVNTEVNGNTAPADDAGDQGRGGSIATANFGIPGAATPLLTLINGHVIGNSASGDGGGIANLSFGGPLDPVTPRQHPG